MVGQREGDRDTREAGVGNIWTGRQGLWGDGDGKIEGQSTGDRGWDMAEADTRGTEELRAHMGSIGLAVAAGKAGTQHPGVCRCYSGVRSYEGGPER